MEKEIKNQILWDNFAKRNLLSSEQIDQFKKYYNLLIEHNKLYNITAITDLESIINDHFEDSLALSKAVDLNDKVIVDIGSGGGFPGIPLKIRDNSLKVILIEVILKKVNFLETVIEELNLDNIETCNLDWRTFLRTPQEPLENKVNYFCARASLHTDELLRVFKPSSFYKNSSIVYWASKNWIPTKEEKELIYKTYSYQNDNKQRQLIFFKSKI